MKITVQHFFLGVMIAFTISVILLSAIMIFAFEAVNLPIVLIWQSFVLSVLCSLINLVYRSEKLKFIWQSIIGYILTVGTIITCGFIFDWYHFGGSNGSETKYILISFFVYSLFYFITWVIIWKLSVNKQKELNKKLKEYKQKL